ncbi:hypothetical protein Tco_1156684 [Tanacetum coccineum]
MRVGVAALWYSSLERLRRVVKGARCRPSALVIVAVGWVVSRGGPSLGRRGWGGGGGGGPDHMAYWCFQRPAWRPDKRAMGRSDFLRRGVRWIPCATCAASWASWGLNPRRDSPYVMGSSMDNTIRALETCIHVAMAHSSWVWDLFGFLDLLEIELGG